MNTGGGTDRKEESRKTREKIIALLEGEGFQIEALCAGGITCRPKAARECVLIFLDKEFSSDRDRRLLQHIKAVSPTKSRIILLLPRENAAVPQTAIAKGLVDDFVFTPLNSDLFMHTVRENVRRVSIETNIARYRKLSMYDYLTNLFNRRYFNTSFTSEVGRALRYKHDLSLLMADIDNFKQFNDSYGHPAGDAALKKVAHVLRMSLRKIDIICRYGGEEFALILPDTPKKGALTVAERLRCIITRTQLETDYGTRSVTISIGAASIPPDAKGKDDLLLRADQALYRAKRQSKNKVSS